MDLVFTNSSQVEIGDRFDESDHDEIRFKINAKRKEDKNKALMPDFRKKEKTIIRALELAYRV